MVRCHRRPLRSSFAYGPSIRTGVRHREDQSTRGWYANGGSRQGRSVPTGPGWRAVRPATAWHVVGRAMRPACVFCATDALYVACPADALCPPCADGVLSNSRISAVSEAVGGRILPPPSINPDFALSGALRASQRPSHPLRCSGLSLCQNCPTLPQSRLMRGRKRGRVW